MASLIPVAVLAGGVAARFSINKLLYPLRGRPLIQHLLDRLRRCQCVSEITVVASPFNVTLFEGLGVNTVVDTMCVGPLGGIYAALRLYGRALVVGGDMPKVGCSYVEKMLELCDERCQACIPAWRGGYMEPLAAVYSSKFLTVLEYGIAIGEYSIQRLVRILRPEVKVVSIEEHLSGFAEAFENVNTLDDVHRLAESV